MKLKNKSMLLYIYLAIACSCTAKEGRPVADNIKLPPTATASVPSIYEQCAARANAIHPEMISCMDEEIKRNEDKIKLLLEADYDEVTAKISRDIQISSSQWNAYVERKCGRYLQLGGQRGELLQKSCVVSEFQLQKSYIDDLIFAIGM